MMHSQAKCGPPQLHEDREDGECPQQRGPVEPNVCSVTNQPAHRRQDLRHPEADDDREQHGEIAERVHRFLRWGHQARALQYHGRSYSTSA